MLVTGIGQLLLIEKEVVIGRQADNNGDHDSVDKDNIISHVELDTIKQLQNQGSPRKNSQSEPAKQLLCSLNNY